MSESSVLLRILNRASHTIQTGATQQGGPPATLPYTPDSERRQRPAPATPLPLALDPNAPAIRLESINQTIAQLRAWLQANPLFLKILDESIRQEIQAMERRTNRMGIVINGMFTLIGGLIGLVLPPLASLVAVWLSHR